MLEHHYADLPNGIRLHYACAGTGPLLLFVHGFPEFWYGWKDQLVEFGRDHLAVALEHEVRAVRKEDRVDLGHVAHGARRLALVVEAREQRGGGDLQVAAQRHRAADDRGSAQKRFDAYL